MHICSCKAIYPSYSSASRDHFPVSAVYTSVQRPPDEERAKIVGDAFERVNTMNGNYDARDIVEDEVVGAAFGRRGGGGERSQGRGRGSKFRKDSKRKSRAPPCRYWAMGSCRDGDRCKFFHGEKSRPRAAPATQQSSTDDSKKSNTDATDRKGGKA